VPPPQSRRTYIVKLRQSVTLTINLVLGVQSNLSITSATNGTRAFPRVGREKAHSSTRNRWILNQFYMAGLMTAPITVIELALMLCGLPRPAEDGRVAEVLVSFLQRAAADLQRRPDWPRRHPVHADTFGCKLFGQRLDLVHRRRLGLSIVVKVRRRVVGLLGGRADDA
jgi:hypothetical protein